MLDINKRVRCEGTTVAEMIEVTYIGYNDHEPYCDAFAYRNDGDWYWSLTDDEVRVEITAWKYNSEPYKK